MVPASFLPSGDSLCGRSLESYVGGAGVNPAGDVLGKGLRKTRARGNDKGAFARERGLWPSCPGGAAGPRGGVWGSAELSGFLLVVQDAGPGGELGSSGRWTGRGLRRPGNGVGLLLRGRVSPQCSGGVRQRPFLGGTELCHASF